MIAVDQDPLGRQGRRVRQEGDFEVWAKPLDGGGQAVGLFNRGSATAQIVARCEELQACGDFAICGLTPSWVPEDRRFPRPYRATVSRFSGSLRGRLPERAQRWTVWPSNSTTITVAIGSRMGLSRLNVVRPFAVFSSTADPFASR